MTWTKNEIVEELMERTGLQRNEVVVIVEGVIEIIKEALIRGDRVEIRGFGVFENKKRKRKKARNPRTGEEVIIPERMVPVFKPSRKLREAVEKGG
ncbi:hypothetical protein DRQ16_02630 [bacterium]|nr:MAG: hypothetical protein DRQ18_04560 [bacterium]RKZ22216.1 MAG: hypothetical protein DRQ16_02630 [bacterium]